MKTAKELTELVAKTTAERSEYRGLSDHRPNVHRFDFPDGTILRIGTWNVLNPEYTPAINGIPLPGKDLPFYCSNMNEQAGLEELPQFAPKNESARQEKILSAIKDFFGTHKERTVLCLQEAWPDLQAKIAETGLCKVLNTTEWRSFTLTLISPDLDFVDSTALYYGHGFKLAGFDHAIANLHLPFPTDKSLTEVKAALEWGSKIILGDYNIQTKPISEPTIAEGGRLTLEQYVEELKPRDATFAAHPEGWTIFNTRRNIATNQEQNQDHFDNIMFLDLSAKAEFIPFDPQF